MVQSEVVVPIQTVSGSSPNCAFSNEHGQKSSPSLRRDLPDLQGPVVWRLTVLNMRVQLTSQTQRGRIYGSVQVRRWVLPQLPDEHGLGANLSIKQWPEVSHWRSAARLRHTGLFLCPVLIRIVHRTWFNRGLLPPLVLVWWNVTRKWISWQFLPFQPKFYRNALVGWLGDYVGGWFQIVYLWNCWTYAWELMRGQCVTFNPCSFMKMLYRNWVIFIWIMIFYIRYW